MCEEEEGKKEEEWGDRGRVGVQLTRYSGLSVIRMLRDNRLHTGLSHQLRIKKKEMVLIFRHTVAS